MTVLSVCVTGLSAAPANPEAPPRVQGNVSNYLYGRGGGWALPSQTTKDLAERAEQLRRQEADLRQREEQWAREIASAPLEVAPAPRSEQPPAPVIDGGHQGLTWLGAVIPAGIAVAAGWKFSRQRRCTPSVNEPMIIPVDASPLVCAMVTAPRFPLRRRERRFGGVRRAGPIGSDDLQMFFASSDATPQYAYTLDPVGMAQAVARAREATAVVWSHQVPN